MAEKGSLPITSENVFPAIKEWLYSDHDIFYRELISNDSDATTKLEKLELVGKYRRPGNLEYKTQVSVNPNDRTIKITDDGLGMTEDEIDKYINQIAFPGVQDFMERYKGKVGEDQIIGYFGLGFYSAFAVAGRVSTNSLPYQEGFKPIHWESEGGVDSEIGEGDRAEAGTTIALYLNEDSTGFCNEYRARKIIEKYCTFVPVSIFLDNETAEPQCETTEKDELTDKDTVVEIVTESAKTEEKEKEDGTEEVTEIEPSRKEYKVSKRPVTLNDVSPLWNKYPNECSEGDYKSFYRKVFRDYKEPLFQVRLNMDCPFNSKGILYFPKINMEYDSLEGTIKLYNSQVSIANNIKEVIPEFLMLLKGVIDCPDPLLDVSRSALQNDGFVKKISDYITKKVADKPSDMCKIDRGNYEKYWDNIAPFIKFGYIRDEEFAEKMEDFILYKNLEGRYLTLRGCLDENKEKYENTILYATNEKERSQYIDMFKGEGIDAVIMSAAIGSSSISHVEQEKEDLKLLRIDTDLDVALEEDVKEDDEEFKKTSEELTKCFRRTLNNDKLDVEVEEMKSTGVASTITISEDTRRMQDTMKMYSMGGMDVGMFGGTGETLVLNVDHPLVQYVLGHKDDANTSKICEQLYDLVNSGHGPLAPDRMTAFVSRSNGIMMTIADEKAESEKAE